MTTLLICDCKPAGVQLVELGYFPCAPVRPSLAVDINFLEFVTTASHYMAPNVLGWASTLHEFLHVRAYSIGSEVIVLVCVQKCVTHGIQGFDPSTVWQCVTLVSSSCGAC
jgi:hypothetical protein